MTQTTRAGAAADGAIVARLRKWSSLVQDELSDSGAYDYGLIYRSQQYQDALIQTSREAAAVIEARDAEIARQEAEIASLRLTLGGRTFSAAVPEPIGCPAPGACVQVAEIARLREALLECAGDLEDELKARYGSPPHPVEVRRYERDMETVRMARQIATAALAPPPASDGGEA